MGEDEEDKLLVAAQKWSLESSSAPLEQSSSNCNISQDVSPHHIMSKDIPTLSTSAGTITPTPVNLDDDSDSNFPSNSHAEQSSVPSYINNPLVWAPLSTNDFIGDPSVIAAALSGTSDIADRVVQYEEVTVPSVPRSISPPRSSRDTVVDTAQQYHTAMQMQIPKTRLDELGISKPPTSSRDRDTVPTKTISDELSVEGCTGKAADSGTCKYKHGGYDHCKHEGCTNQVINKGVCVKHGAAVKTCKHEGCTNKARGKEGVCAKHGAVLKTCSHEGCTNIVINKGVCVKHGAVGKKRKICSHEGCTNQVINRGVCVRHGAKVKICKEEGCTNYSQRGGVCIKHGAKVKTCSHGGCINNSKKGGLCIRHYRLSNGGLL